MLERARELAAREDRADRLRDELAQAALHRDQTLAEFAACCLALSAARQQASATLSRALVATLGELGMAKAQFYIELATAEDPEGIVQRDGRHYAAGEHGMEPSPSTFPPMRPTTATLSAHCLGRGNFARDAGPQGSGRRARPRFDLGLRRNRRWDLGTHRRGRRSQTTVLAAAHQTIVITHLPQIASLADQHFSVRKQQEQQRTTTEVVLLDATARAEEIAYLLAGETISDTARQHAREMLQ